jgi:hypothetical protein
VTDEEWQLLETTARIVLKLTEDISDRVAGIEAVLLALFRAHGRTDVALAKLRVQADFLKMKGTPSAYLSSFVDRAAGNRVADSELDVSFGGSNGRQQT